MILRHQIKFVVDEPPPLPCRNYKATLAVEYYLSKEHGFELEDYWFEDIPEELFEEFLHEVVSEDEVVEILRRRIKEDCNSTVT